MKMIKQFQLLKVHDLFILLLTTGLISCGSGNNSYICQQKEISDSSAAPVAKNILLETDCPSPCIAMDVDDPENDLCSVSLNLYYPSDVETPTNISNAGNLFEHYNNETDLYNLSFCFGLEFSGEWRLDIILIDQKGNSTTIKDIYLNKRDFEENQNSPTVLSYSPVIVFLQTEPVYFIVPNGNSYIGTINVSETTINVNSTPTGVYIFPH